MATQPAKSHVKHLLTYVIASADMYYAEMEQRDVFMSCDEQGNIRIWGKISEEESSTTVDLFEIFLEYALYCCSWSSPEETLYNMQDFGERLGRSLARQLENKSLSSVSDISAIQILKHIFETVEACPCVENVDGGVRCIVADYPLEKAAEHSGLRNVELAHYGINSMCQSLLCGLNPSLALRASSDARSEFIFTILTPSFA